MNKKNAKNQQFLQKLAGIVEDHIDNEQFGVTDLAREMGMSRSQIHRRLQELTGQSTTRFIREIRLQRAMKLLQNQVGTVSEIAYRVGFSSPAYFSTCFHEFYGYPPGEVAEQHEQMPENKSAIQKVTTATGRTTLKKLFFAAAAGGLILLLAGYYYLEYNRAERVSRAPSVAVLPLDNLTGDSTQQYFVDGLHDALIGELGQISELRVISRTSTLQFRDTESNLGHIASQLNVENLIEGSVMRTGDSVRIQVQLVHADPREQHIWSQQYDRDTREILVMLSDVSREIARNIEVRLTPVEDSLLAHRREVNPDAYKAYLRGWYHLNRFTPEGYEKGIRYLVEATRIDPGDPLPWARLALGYNTAGHGSSAPADAFEKARAAARKALRLDNSLGEVHLSFALSDLYEEWDWEEAKKSFQKALRYDPNMAEARAHYSYYLILEGAGLNEVAEQGQRAMDLDPFIPLYSTFLGFIYWWGGEYEKAIAATEKTLALDPDFALAHYTLGMVYTSLGQYEEALRYQKRASELNSDFESGLAFTYAKAGYPAKAKNIADKLGADPKPIDTWGLAEVYAALGEQDKAFKWLEECYQVRFSWYPWFFLHNNFEPLKTDPRFKAHLERLNLPFDIKPGYHFQ